MTKTPFELRFDVLSLARDITEQKRSAKVERFYAKLDALRSADNPIQVDIDNHIQNSPDAYTEDEVIETAKKLYSFVADTGEKK